MKKNILWIVALASMVWAPSALCAQEKLAVVDVQRVLDTIEEGKKARDQFKREMDNKKTEVEKKQAELKKLSDSFDKQKMILSPSALEDKRKEMESKQMDYQRSAMTAQAEMAKREQDLVQPVLKKIKDVIEKVGRDGAYTMVLEKSESGVVYYKPVLDVTDQVITLYDKTYGKK
ncbi:MAG: OmpH family outer membrane protein [Pseudomonadota bacterium]